VIRTRSNPLEVAPAVRRAVWAVDKNQPVFDTRSMEDVVAETFAQPRVMASLTGTFASAALLVAAFGVYGLLSYVVSQRTRDIGIRRALGAQPSDTMRLVLRQGLTLTAIGIVLGLTGAAAVTRYLQGMLFGVTPLDPSTFVAVSLMFLLVATVASYVPARRATKVDPLVALRCE
jgi:putative ABC transport system permease protein